MLTDDIMRGAKGKPVRPKTAGQKRYIDAIRENVITFGLGPAGTGKSWLAVAMAVQALQQKQVQRIILTRPAVEAGERLGFLPGDLMAKIDPYLRPLYDALYDMVEPEGAQKLLERQMVEVAPLAFMRGRTLNTSFIILDEAQNATPEQMKMFLTRIGFGSKVVVTGDTTQVDVPDGRSGLLGLERTLTGIDGLGLRAPRRRRRGPPPDRRRHRRRLRARRPRRARPPQHVRSARGPWPRRGPAPSCLTGRDRRRREPGASAVRAIPRCSAPTSRATSPSTSRAGRRWRSTCCAPRACAASPSCRCCSSPRPRSPSSTSGTWATTGPTDVLSFPIDAELADVVLCAPSPSRGPDRAPPDLGDMPILLGDVVICPAVAARQAPEHAGTLDDELALLVVHGVLHVLGHDHAEDAERTAMRARELDVARGPPLARPGPGRPSARSSPNDVPA